MINLSRRQLAHFAVEQLIDGNSLQKISKQLAAILAATNKQKEAELLINDISQELESRGLIANAKVTTATPLPPALRAELIAQIKKTAKVQTAVIEEEVSKDVIGGFRVETANHTWDKTIARRLADIKGGI